MQKYRPYVKTDIDVLAIAVSKSFKGSDSMMRVGRIEYITSGDKHVGSVLSEQASGMGVYTAVNLHYGV